MSQREVQRVLLRGGAIVAAAALSASCADILGYGEIELTGGTGGSTSTGEGAGTATSTGQGGGQTTTGQGGEQTTSTGQGGGQTTSTGQGGGQTTSTGQGGGQTTSTGQGGACTPGEEMPCYDGPPGTQGVGLCAPGAITCLMDGSGFSGCKGQVTPAAELCAKRFDESCDGSAGCTGNAVWSIAGTAHAIAVDAQGNIYTITTSSGDVLVTRRSRTGALEWQKTFGGAGAEAGRGVAVLPNGRVYITGTFDTPFMLGALPLTPAAGNDIFVAELDTAGDPVWAKSYGGAGNDFPLQLAPNPAAAGQLVTLAFCQSLGNALCVFRFDENGVDQGSAVLQGQYDGATRMALDPQGNLFTITSETGVGNDAGYAAVVRKQSLTGVLAWRKSLDGAGDEFQGGIAADTKGGVVAAFMAYVPVDLGLGAYGGAGNTDAHAARLDGAGTVVWHWHRGTAGTEEPYAVTVDGADSVILAGRFDTTIDFGQGPVDPIGGMTSFVVKLDLAGNPLWSQRIQDPGGFGTVRALTTFLEGDVIVANFASLSRLSP